MPADSTELDARAAANAYPALFRRPSSVKAAQVVVLDMNWERSMLVDGGGVALGIFYTNDLLADGVWSSGRGRRRYETVYLAFALYDLEVVILDGLSCKTPGAVAHCTDQTIIGFGPIWRYGQSLSP